MTGKWLTDNEWSRVQHELPIFCVDAVPLRQSAVGLEIGLILRQTPHQGDRWCFPGGRVCLDETLHEALVREWQSAFDLSLEDGAIAVSEPCIVEYERSNNPNLPHDPRKHAISATYGVRCQHDLAAHGDEALAFRWFVRAGLNGQLMGFGQETIVAALLDSRQFMRILG